MRIHHLLTVAAIAVVLGGCPSTTQGRSVERSGFLSDYSRLQEGEGDQALERYVDETADFTKYDSVIVEPVQIRRSEDSDIDDISAEDQKSLVDYLHHSLVRELEKDYKVVDTASGSTLRLRAALTDADDAEVVLDTISTIIPTTLVVSQLMGLATGTPSFVGSASVEVSLTDADNGAVLAEAVDRRVGGKSLSGITGDWSDVQQAFDSWAERVRAFLAERRGETVSDE